MGWGWSRVATEQGNDLDIGNEQRSTTNTTTNNTTSSTVGTGSTPLAPSSLSFPVVLVAGDELATLVKVGVPQNLHTLPSPGEERMRAVAVGAETVIL